MRIPFPFNLLFRRNTASVMRQFDKTIQTLRDVASEQLENASRFSAGAAALEDAALALNKKWAAAIRERDLALEQANKLADLFGRNA